MGEFPKSKIISPVLDCGMLCLESLLIKSNTSIRLKVTGIFFASFTPVKDLQERLFYLKLYLQRLPYTR